MSKYNTIKINLASDIKEDNKNERKKIKSSNSIRKYNSKKFYKDLKSENPPRISANIFDNNNNLFSFLKKPSLYRINNICSPTRIKRKTTKKKSMVAQKLNEISKNIENANNAINNPYEFYLNLFTNLIRKKTKTENESQNNEEDYSSLKILILSHLFLKVNKK